MDKLDKGNIHLDKTRSQLSYLLRGRPVVIYAMDLSPRFKGTFISENITTLTGYSTTESLTDNFWSRHLHADDRRAALEKLQNSFEQKQQNITLEYRFKHLLGHYLWIQDTATVTYSDSGQPLSCNGSWTDIGELKAKQAELTRAHEELDQFAYIASHDLKEPLRGIHNYSNFLLEDYSEKLDQEGRSKLKTLTRLTKRMEDLINSLLSFSRLGRVDLSYQPTNLNELLTNILDTLRVELNEQNIEVRVPRPLPCVACDSRLIGDVFSNLITNAMEYNDKPDKWIEIGYQSKSQSDKQLPTNNFNPGPHGPVTFYVRDNGIGIREKHLDAIFRIFKRLHGREKYGGGTGAGLTVVKKIIERHHGEIWADSRFGEGSTFCFTLI